MTQAIRAEMIETIRGITPTLDPAHPFSCLDDATGSRAALEDVTDHGATRYFEIRSTGSADLGMTGVTMVRYAESLEVRVGYYAAGADAARLDRIMAQDARDIIAALRDPNNYGSADALIPGREPPVVDQLDNGLIQAVPVTAVYVQ